MNLDVPYGITRRLAATSLADARARVTESLKAEGFGVLTEIDLAGTLKKKLDVDVAPYVILGACNPTLAHRAITKEPGVGLLLPCNVVVAQDGDDALISALNPSAMFAAAQGADLADVAADAEARLRRAVERA